MNYTETGMFNRLLAALLSFVMVVALLPMGLLVPIEAAPGDTAPGETEENVGFTVTVTDEEDKPIEGAAVMLSGGIMNNSWSVSSTTDDNGVAVFEDLEKNLSDKFEQNISVEITADGYVTGVSTVSMKKDNMADKSIEVKLEAKIPCVFSVETKDEDGNEDENATVTLNGEECVSVNVFKDETVELVITPKQGYKITEVKLGDVTVEGLPEAGEAFEDTISVGADISVSYTLERIVYNVSVESDADKGTVTPSEENPEFFTYDDTYKAHIESEEGYLISSVTVNDTEYAGIKNVKSADIELKVTADTAVEVTYVKLHTVTVTFGENGSGNAYYGEDELGNKVSFDSVIDGDSVLVDAEPVEGYEVFEVTTTVGNTDTKAELTADDKDGFEGKEFVINGDTAITVSFVLKKYTVTVTDNDKTASVTAPDTVEHGSDAVISITPVVGYVVDKITVNGKEAEFTADANDTASLTVEGVTEDITVEVSYVLKKYTVTVTENDKTASVTAPDTVEHGSDATITVAPTVGYVVDKIYVNDAEAEFTKVGDGASVTVKAVSGDVTVAVSYVLKEYTVKVQQNPELYTVDEKITVKHGYDATVKITPTFGYVIESVKVGEDVYPATFVDVAEGDDYYEAVIPAVTGNIESVTVQAVIGEQVEIWDAITLTFGEGTLHDQIGNGRITQEPYTNKYGWSVPGTIVIDYVVNKNGTVTISAGEDGTSVSLKANKKNKEGENLPFTVEKELTLTQIKLHKKYNNTTLTQTINGKTYAVEFHFIVDETKPIITFDSNGNGFTNASDYAFTFNVEDPKDANKYSSGIGSCGASISYTDTNGDVVEQDLQLNYGQGKYLAEISLVNIPEGKVTFKVTCTDKVGNSTTEYREFTKDVTDPVIDVEFDNNTVKNDRYFSEKRTAKVTVTEQNFDPAKAVITVNGETHAWTEYENTANGDVYTAIVPFDADGRYTFSVTCTDKAGNVSAGVSYAEGTEAPESFVVDTTAPEDLAIEYKPSFTKMVINALTFGFFGDDKIEVVFTVKDDISNIDYIVYYIPYVEGEGASNVGMTLAPVIKEGTYTGSFFIPAQYRNKIKFEAYNMAGLGAYIVSDQTIVVDNIDPVISVDYTTESKKAPSENGGELFYNENVTAVIKINEANFFGTDEWDRADYENGNLVITVEKTYNDGRVKTETLEPAFTADAETEDLYVSEPIKFTENADYKFTVLYTDNAGNDAADSGNAAAEDGVYGHEHKFTLDKTAPVINVKYDNNDVRNDEFFNKDRYATVTVTEHNFDPAKAVITINGKDHKWTDYSNTANGDVYTATVPFNVDGAYTFSVECTDKAENANVGVSYAKGTEAPEKFTVDKTPAESVTIVYAPKGYFLTMRDMLVHGFYNPEVEVTIIASDSISGIDYFVYSAPVEEGASGVNTGIGKTTAVPVFEDGKYSYTFTVAAQYRGQISVDVYNMAGDHTNYTDEKITIVDSVSPEVTVEYTAASGKAPTENAGELFYSEDVTAIIKINEANFFGTDEWGNADYDNGKLVITVEKTYNDGRVETETIRPRFTADAKEEDLYVSEPIKFTENADYKFTVLYTDNSGNNAPDSGNAAVTDEAYGHEHKFTLDKTAPVIDVKYDNNAVANGKYFNKDRYATVTVTEHNFDPTKAVITINGTPHAWTEYQAEDNGDVHSIVVPFDVDGAYTFSVECADKAENSDEGVNYAEGTAAAGDFVIDKTAPTDLTIEYTQSFKEMLINAFSFGFFGDDEIEVTVTAKDDISGIDYFVYSVPVEQGASSVNKGIEATTVKSDDKGTVYTYTFKIPAQYRGKVSFDAYNMASDVSSLTDDRIIVVDNIDPVITVDYTTVSGKAPTENAGELFYNEDVTAIIKINEANFFGTDEWDRADYENGNLVITVEKIDSESDLAIDELRPEFMPHASEEDVYESEPIVFSEDVDYKFIISYTDNSGNTSSYEHKFTLDKTAPVINVEYDNNDVRNGEFFNADRTVTITVTEHNFDPANIKVDITAKNVDEVKAESYKAAAAALTKLESWTRNEDVYTARIAFTDEAEYSFNISGTDKALNANLGVSYANGTAAPGYFVIDKTSPTDLAIKIEGDIVASFEDKAINFYDKPVTVKLSAVFNISGLDHLEYQKVSVAEQYDPNGRWDIYNEDTGIYIGTGEQAIIYFNAVDRALNDNVNDHGRSTVINSVKIIVDDKAPVGVDNELDIDIIPAKPNANNLHNGDVKVEFKVTDPKYNGQLKDTDGFYSGIREVTYEIIAEDIDAQETGILFKEGAVPATTKAQYGSEPLVHTVTGSFVISSAKFNSNNVVVVITAVDNAGNTTVTETKLGDIRIDTTAPTVRVEFDNNIADSGKYFDADRTATVVVTERNFSADGVKFTLTCDGAERIIAPVWTKTEAGGNGDGTTHTAQITFNTDGDYVFTVDSVTDLADLVCGGADVDYGNSVAPNEFTLDYVKPVINVTYDNNDAANGNYYKADRTATVVITEHNLDPNGADSDRIIVTVGATDDGAVITAPVITAWTTVGDVHTATISYTSDALYTFDISVADKAGNASDDFAQQSFYVDKTVPALTIGGVADKSANNGEVIPVITYSDTNFDASAVKITLIGANRGELELDGSFADIHNGNVFTFNDFANEKSADDIYTLAVKLVDKAGNASEETITFSVNRFGSTYALDDDTKEIGGLYIKNPIDIVITETNANELSGIKVTLFRNNEAKVLAEGTDYKIELEGGDGMWYKYTYVIYAENFTADGVYSITVESDDEAGNVAKNDLDTKNTRVVFGVDNTLPIINIENLESRSTYATDKLTVMMSVQDNLKLAKVIVELDGQVIKEWTGEALVAVVNGTGDFSFDIDGTSTEAHRLVVYAMDEAGNGEVVSDSELPKNAEVVENFFVTTNLWVRYFTNKPLFYGSIGGAVLAAGLIIFLIIFKKRKKNGEK